MKVLLKALLFFLCTVSIFPRTVMGAQSVANCKNVSFNWVLSSTKINTIAVSNNGSKWYKGSNCSGDSYENISDVINFSASNWGYPAFVITNETEAKSLFNKINTEHTTSAISSSTTFYSCTYTWANGPSCDLPLGQALTVYMPVYVNSTIDSKLLQTFDSYRNNNNTITVYPISMCSQYATINFYGISSSGTYTKIGTAKYDYATNKWKKSSDNSNVTKIDELGFALNISNVTYNSKNYKKGISAYAALYSAVNLTEKASEKPSITNINILSTSTTGKVSTSAEKPNILVGGTLPDLSGVLFKGNNYADEVKYIVLYAANCLDEEGTETGATCSLKIGNGRALYTNSCLNGTSFSGTFGSTTVPVASSVSVTTNFTGNKTCSAM